VSSELEQPPARTFRAIVLGGGLLSAALGGAVAMRLLAPAPRPATRTEARPIVQIVRQQPGLPDLADLVDRLCPSVALIVPHGSDAPSPSSKTVGVPATVFSSDGWLVTSSANLPDTPLDAVFGDGHRADLTDVRTDPVSGLTIVKAASTIPAPLALSDQAFARVGQFGLALSTPVGSGCSAGTAMISSDFLADGGSTVGYVRLQTPPEGWKAGMTLVGADGRVIGIGIDDEAGGMIPAPIASVIIDELVRNSLSPTTNFGFRAIDYPAPLSTRIGNVRSGAGVALVQAKSAAAKAGMRAGDIVTAVNDNPVSSASELSRALDALPEQATLTIQRSSQQVELTIKRSRS
jgi:serine protease Do